MICSFCWRWLHVSVCLLNVCNKTWSCVVFIRFTVAITTTTTTIIIVVKSQLTISRIYTSTVHLSWHILPFSLKMFASNNPISNWIWKLQLVFFWWGELKLHQWIKQGKPKKKKKQVVFCCSHFKHMRLSYISCPCEGTCLVQIVNVSLKQTARMFEMAQSERTVDRRIA